MEDVSTGVLEKNKEYLRSKDKDKDDMIYQDIYIIAYVKIQKKLKYTIHYVKPTPQLVFKIDFQKVVQHAGGKWLIHDTKRCKDNQLQSLKVPCRISKLSSWMGHKGGIVEHQIPSIEVLFKKCQKSQAFWY